MLAHLHVKNLALIEENGVYEALGRLGGLE